MKPDKAGIWEWIDNDGSIKLVYVCNVAADAEDRPWLRVFFAGGYYNVHDECVGTWEEKFMKSEWPDRWGKFVAKLTERGFDTDTIYWRHNQKSS
jgi:hypothetical protein